MDEHAPWTPGDRGSVLLLFPAAFLIVLVLGAIAVDAGVVFMRQRELAAAAAAAANDASTLAVRGDVLRGEGRVEIDLLRLEDHVLDSLDRRGVLPTLAEPPRVTLLPDGRVEVSLVRTAEHVISPALPGSAGTTTVSATATARLVVDDG